MRSTRCQIRLSAWIASLAILWAALVPFLPQVMGRMQAQAWSDICSGQTANQGGTARDAGTGSLPPGAMHDHCALCALHVPPIGCASAALVLLPASVLHRALPTAFLAAPYTLHAWVSAPPRGPPPIG